MIKTIKTGLLLLAMAFITSLANVNAESFITQDGLSVNIFTDKEDYSQGEEIQVTVKIKNNNRTNISGISIETLLPNDFFLKEENKVVKDISIAAGNEHSEIRTVVANHSNNPNLTPIPKPNHEGDINESSAEIKNEIKNEKSPQTGDYIKIGVYILLGILSLIGIIVLLRHKNTIKSISIFLSIIFTLSIIPFNVFSDYNKKSIKVDKTIKYNSIEYSIGAIISYPSNDSSQIKQTIKSDSSSNTTERNTSDQIVNSVDSDKDGLPDDIEKKYKTDINNPDTDSDGLSDYMETMILSYNPLSSDTDNNGIADGDEDPDQDKISNIEEIRLGTDPTIKDTDGDGLWDSDEINNYKTDPKLEDTDSDGANDGWEIEHHFDPLVFNKSFDVEIYSKQSTDDKVTASVKIDTNGKQAQSINVEPVNNNSEAFVSDSIPGYLGSAYEFTADGDIPGATLSFSYDPSLAKDSNNFVPRIYYLNEENNTLEELEDQTVEGTKVSAYVSHFSKYILLNKVEFDKVWEYEIQEPIFDDDTMDIMFVIDYSASMEENDPNQIFKEVTQKFVAKLRDGKDRAGAVKFVRAASSVCNLTTDKAKISDAVKSICYDDGYSDISGTNGSAGLKMALDGLNTSNSKHKYIVFMTDGDDNTYFEDPKKGIVLYDYEDLIAEANRQSITIYTVGLGKVNTENLTNIAEKTGGKYYHATEAENLEEAFENVGSKTVDLTKDSNNDGIPDYYNELIKQGKLVLSNGSTQFRGIDFNFDKDGKPSSDYDGDGIKNGTELKVVKHGKYVYLEMHSDPTKVDSDGDGFVDSKDTNPLKWDVSDRDLAIFANNAYNNDLDHPESYTSDYNEVKDYWQIVDSEAFNVYIYTFNATTYKNGNDVVISFRGTGSIPNWIWDFIGYGGMNFHPTELNAKLYALRTIRMYPKCNIHITGHSLGGYLAQISACEILRYFPNANLKQIVYFDGNGINFNKIFPNGPYEDTPLNNARLLKDYNQNHRLISYRINGDLVSLLGDHYGKTYAFDAAPEAIKMCKEKYGTTLKKAIEDLLSIKGSIKAPIKNLLSIISKYANDWYSYYGCSNFEEYMWLTHATEYGNFLHSLSAGIRRGIPKDLKIPEDM